MIKSSWYPDSGASNHVTCDLNNLGGGSEHQGSERVHMRIGTGLHISHFGNFVVNVPNSIHSSSFLLKNLLHAPHIRNNLLSVSQFAKDNHVILSFTHLIVL